MKTMGHVTRSARVSSYSNISKQQMQIMCLLAKIQIKNTRNGDVCMQKINNDLMYLIQFLYEGSNDFKLFPFQKKTLSDQFNDNENCSRN